MVSVLKIVFGVCAFVLCNVSAQEEARPAPSSWCAWLNGAELAKLPLIAPMMPPRCPINQVYSCCAPCPEKTCKTILDCPVKTCIGCVERCICKSGYVRQFAGGPCIPIGKCFPY